MQDTSYNDACTVCVSSVYELVQRKKKERAEKYLHLKTKYSQTWQ